MRRAIILVGCLVVPLIVLLNRPAFPQQWTPHLRSPVSLRSANMNSTADQTVTVPTWIGKYTIRAITFTNCSISMTTAVGGFYTAASKGGTALVANTQAYSTLTGSAIWMDVTLAAGASSGGAPLTGNFFFSLTTPQGAAATCDILADIQDFALP